MNADFYRAFEERYRGPRELIKGRLKVYLPFIAGLRSAHPRMRALDLGCGRGEWLELMREHGIETQGVDLDAGMLKACRDLDLDVVQEDAIRHLEAQPDASFGVVSAFHVAEHLPFEALQDLVGEALRALLPGGLLILETPNPENLVVGTANFYLDPTHIRPIPAPLLAFLPEFHGFARCKILGLQEPRQSDDTAPVTLRQVLNGVSPDYAVVAQAPGGTDQLSALDEAFARDYGVSLANLTDRFDHQLKAGLTEIRDEVTRIKEDWARTAEDYAQNVQLHQELAAAASTAVSESATTAQALRDHMSALEGRLAAEEEKAAQRLELKAQVVRTQMPAETAERDVRVLEDRLHEFEERHRTMESLLAQEEARAREVEALIVGLEGRARELEDRAERAEQRLNEALSLSRDAATSEAEQRQQIDDLAARAHHWWLQASALEAERDALRRSWSWRVTAPLRRGVDLLHYVPRRKKLPKASAGGRVRGVVVGALERPRLVAFVHRCLRPFPRVHERISRRVAEVVNGAPSQMNTDVLPAKTRSRTDQRRRIFVDISELVQRDAGTGVQRVTRNILQQMRDAPPQGYAVLPVYGTPHRVGYRHADGLFAHLKADDHGQVDEPLQPEAGDLFIGLDLQHHVVIRNRSYFQTLREHGVLVFFVVYDLLPALRPEFFPSGMGPLHRDWLKVVAESDGALCISKAVATELRTWMEVNAPERLSSYSIRHFTLGADINGLNASRGWPADGEQILATLQVRPTFLMVGTIEPRKGYAQVLGAFEQLWGRGVDINLAIVGRPGWLVDSLLKRLRRHPESGKRLLWLQQISDEFLDAIYPAAVCLIAASESEGYGLPLVEAARHRLPIIARDIAPFREIAHGSAFFFNSTTASGLASEIEEWLEAKKTDSHPKPYGIDVVTWEQSASELLDCVLPVNAPYLVGNGPKEDGMISVDEVLAGIHSEMNGPRG